MHRPLLTLLAFICFYFSSNAQTPPPIDWQKGIGGSNDDQLYSIDLCADGGYILGGVSRSNISGDKSENARGLSDYWIVKLDIAGNIQWQKTLGGNSTEVLEQILQTSDGGYIVAGSSFSGLSGDKTEGTNGQADYWIVKLDSLGNLQWQNTIGGNDYDFAQAVIETSDSAYIIAGYSSSSISGDKNEDPLGGEDFWVLKLNQNGTILWQHTIGGNGEDLLYNMKATAWGTYMLVGSSSSTISADKTEPNQGFTDYWMVEIDSLGNLLRQKTIGGNSYDAAYGLVVNTDGTYLLTGTSETDISGDKTVASFGGADIWTIKLDTSGLILWQTVYGGNANELAFEVNASVDGGYLISANSNSAISGNKTEGNFGINDYWIIKIDALGAIEWQKTLGANLLDEAQTGVQTLDDGFLIGGRSASGIAGNKTVASQGGLDYWLVKFKGDCGGLLTAQSVDICLGETYDFYGQILDSSGIYRDTFQNSLGCDSIIELNLNVHLDYSNTNSISICQGDSILLGGQYYSQAGTYVDSFLTIWGCDSIEITNLDILPLPNPIISDLGDSLVVGDYAFYQWYFNGNPITNANDPYLIPSQSGWYAVEVIDTNACANSSMDFQYIVLANRMNDQAESLMYLYPNPTAGQITLELNLKQPAKLELWNTIGQLVYNLGWQAAGNTELNLALDLPPATYIILLRDQYGKLTQSTTLVVRD